MFKKLAMGVAAVGLLGACSATTPPGENMELIQGPAPVVDVRTVYDDALTCVAGELENRATFTLAVGEIADATGKFSAEGNGYYITQAAGDILQSALVTAQPDDVVNRRNTKVMELEMTVGRTLNWAGSDAHATGSISTLDFIPGGGVEVSIAGIGGKARQYRMNVGMDLFLTDTVSSRIVAKSQLDKQIVAYDYGANVGRFFGDTLVTMNIGEQQREAVGFATRNMLKLAAFELLSDLYKDDFAECRALIENVDDVLDAEQTAQIKEAQQKVANEQEAARVAELNTWAGN